MCVGQAPKIPAPSPPPPPPQAAKAPDMNAVRKAGGSSPLAGGSLLTGPSGIAANALNTGSKSLLGS